MQKQKDLLSDVFGEALDGVRDVVICGVPDHENKSILEKSRAPLRYYVQRVVR
jgi:hypothetical protein